MAAGAILASDALVAGKPPTCTAVPPPCAGSCRRSSPSRASLYAPAVRDIGLLDSAAHRPQASAFGQDAYSTIHEKAAALLEAVVRNHALVDGNKRLGWAAAVVFYDLNGLDLDPPSVGEAVELVVAVAGGRMGLGKLSEHLASWADEHGRR